MRSLMHLSPGIAIAATVSLATGLGAEVIDRVAAVVGLEAVALSEIDTEARLEALLNRKDLAVTDANREELLGRLIDRRLVLQDLAGTPFLRAQPDEIEGQMRQLRSLRYLDGRDFPAALRHYGLTEEDCRAFLDARISFERYVSFRFKTGLDTDNEAARAYYEDEYAPRMQAQQAPVEPFADVADRIAAIVIERRANELLDRRLKELRASRRIEILATTLDTAGP